LDCTDPALGGGKSASRLNDVRVLTSLIKIAFLACVAHYMGSHLVVVLNLFMFGIFTQVFMIGVYSI